MADEPGEGGEPASPDELSAAVEKLSVAEFEHLEGVGARLALGIRGLDGSDVLMEAVERALRGTSIWRRGVPLQNFLFGVMRNVANQWREQKSSSARTVPIQGHASDDAAGVDLPSIQANPEQVLLDREAEVQRDADAGETLRRIDALFDDDVEIQAVLYGIRNGRGSAPPGSTHAMSFAPLALAVKDATTFGVDLKRAASGVYKNVHVTYALDHDATSAKLEKIITRLARDVHPRDTFILFVAGHGYSVDGMFYLIPQDYQGGPDPEALRRKAIGQATLQAWLANRIRAKKAVVLLDTCESGALVAGHLRARTDGSMSEAAVGRLHEATGRPVLAAAALGQFALEGLIARSGDRHGLFTWALLDALRSGDTNHNGTIELSEIVAHVQSLVPKLAAELGGTGRTAAGIGGSTEANRQTARFGSRGEDFPLVKRLPAKPE